MKKSLKILISFIIFIFLIFPSSVFASENAKTEIYVAGNPNLESIEYYDDSSNEFCGVIPDFLKKAEDYSSYKFVYINDSKDSRKELSKNKQVELVSGVTPDEKIDNMADCAYTFTYNNGAKDIKVNIMFTDIADEKMKSEILTAFSKVPDKEVSSIALSHLQNDKEQNEKLNIVILVLSAIIFVFVFVLIATLIRKRKKKLELKAEKELALLKEKEVPQLEQDINQAIERNEIKIYIQWAVDAGTEKITCGEILSRWQHPQKGFISADEYISSLEDTKCIIDYDLYILNKTCEVLAKRQKNNKEKVSLSCNMSRQTFSAKNFAQMIGNIIDKYDFDPSLLVIEMTEYNLLNNRDVVLKNLASLKEKSVRIALDDFGTGYASFTDLKQYEFDILKLDKKAIDFVEKSEIDKKLLYQYVSLGHTIGMTVLAEGIETKEQFNIAKNASVDIIQGYYFYHPMPLYESEKII